MAFMTREDRVAIVAGRLAEMKASLRLTSEQESTWSAFSSALRDGIKARAARRTQSFQARSEAQKANAPVDLAARMQNRAACLRARADQVEKLATDGKALFDSLDEGQKRRLGLLLRRGSRRRAGRIQFARLTGYIRRLQASKQ